ncbi:hypothetical protein CHUAL_001950 [Chamberlinius hualienensis]
MDNYYAGVDVGSGSVRVVIVDRNGVFQAKVTKQIQIWNPRADFYQQSTEDIWQATCDAMKEALLNAKLAPEKIKGLGFDATCSLVVLDKNAQPLSVGGKSQNIIMWMDHRAINEAKLVTELGHSVLQQFGGSLSVESNISKILWLKNNTNKEWWNSVGYFLDLPDFMTAKATGDYSTRSLCSSVCKLGYLSDATTSQWDETFWKQLTLDSDLKIKEQDNKLGSKVKNPGLPITGGLCFDAAKDFGLLSGTKVAISLIDAHSGALALWGCGAPGLGNVPLTSRLAMICGTSTCHMAIGDTPFYHSGIWGPFYSVILPQLWIQEAGQSTAGKLLDHIIDTHPAGKLLAERKNQRTVTEELYSVLLQITEDRKLPSLAHLTSQFHVWPNFHGNRSPLANPTLKGMVCGLTLDTSIENLAVLYLATVQALAYETKYILNEMRLNGPAFEVILMCGGLSSNQLYVQVHADVTGLKVVVPKEEDSVALGAAILGASCTKDFHSLTEAMNAMGGEGNVIYPNSNDFNYQQAKYEVFKKMVKHQLEYQDIMNKYANA